MRWLERLRWPLARRRSARISAEAVRRSRPLVWNQVHERAAAMTANEVRGYVRARAIQIVQTETDYLLARIATPGLDRERIARRALETVVEILIRDLIAVRREPVRRRVAA